MVSGEWAVGQWQSARRWRVGYCAVTLALLALIALAGCSESYNGERLHWKAQQLAAPIFQDPSKASPEQIRAAMQAFQAVVDHAPATIWAGRAHYGIGSLQLLQKDYTKARESYQRIVQNYGGSQEMALKARAAIAKSFEVEGDWTSAEKAYKEIPQYHPWSKFGLETPLYLGAVHEKRREAPEAQEAYEQAVRFYTKLNHEVPRPELGYAINGYLALAYQRLGKWDEAAKIYEELAQVPATTVNRPLVLLSLGAIYQTKLQQLDRARAAYEALVAEFPEHTFARAAKVQLERSFAGTEPLPVVPADTPVAAVPEQPDLPPAIMPAPGVSR